MNRHYGIPSFRGKYAFLSNMHLVPHGVHGYPTVEHYFQAMKSTRQDYRRSIMAVTDPFEARRIGRSVRLSSTWEASKDLYMREALRLKFDPRYTYAQLLLATGDDLIEEVNTWRDTYWGICNGVGKNVLGVMLMDLRSRLQKEIVVPPVQRVINVRGGDFTNVDVYIGRSMPQVPDSVQGSDGFWGNPIKIASDTDLNRKEAIVKYWDWLNSEDPRAVANRKAIRAGALKDKNLGCWCAPKLCHGHVLARLANDPDGVQYCKDTIEKFRTQINNPEVS